MSRICAREGCGLETERPKYCSTQCAKRGTVAKPPDPPTIGLDLTITITREEHTAFGVPCDEDIAWIFEDDRHRHRHRR